MKMSTRVRYGLRFMFFLAKNFGCTDKPVLLKDISAKQDISEKYLSQIVLPIKNAGLIISKRGANGGYFLSKSPKEISLGDIYNAIEGEVKLVDCFNRETCDKVFNCVFSEVWLDLSKAFSRKMQNISLQDLLEKEKGLSGIMYDI